MTAQRTPRAGGLAGWSGRLRRLPLGWWALVGGVQVAMLALPVRGFVWADQPLRWLGIDLPMRPWDYDNHVILAGELDNPVDPPLPHFLFQALVRAVQGILPGHDLHTASYLVTLAAAAAGGVVCFEVVRQRVASRRLSDPAAAWVSIVVLLIVLGPMNLNGWESPTFVVLKPFALGLLIAVPRLLEAATGDDAPGPGLRWGTASLVVLATLAKGSLTVVLVPAALLWLASQARPEARARGWRQVWDDGLRARVLRWWWWIAAPGALVSAWSFYVLRFRLEYDPIDPLRSPQAASLRFAPLEVLRNLDPAPVVGGVLLFVVILALGVSQWWWLRRDHVVSLLAWSMVFSQLLVLGFVETAETVQYDGNLGWPAQTVMFLLLVVIARDLSLLVQSGDQRLHRARAWVPVLGFHLFLLAGAAMGLARLACHTGIGPNSC